MNLPTGIEMARGVLYDLKIRILSNHHQTKVELKSIWGYRYRYNRN